MPQLLVKAYGHVLHLPRNLQLLKIVSTHSPHRQGAEASVTFFKAVLETLQVGRAILRAGHIREVGARLMPTCRQAFYSIALRSEPLFLPVFCTTVECSWSAF